jgi:hypothetical protein
MEKELLSKYRSEVIAGFINIEWIINAIICQHYFKKTIGNFLFEVLYDEYFSFGLKRRILEKIVEVDSKKIAKLNRLNTIRNYFAHCNQEVFEVTSENKMSETGIVLDPRNPKKEVDFESLYKEFKEKEGEITTYLADIFKSKGGILEMAKENLGK